jgi:hypothetical protein
MSSSILRTLLGILNPHKPQPENAADPIFVTLFGIAMVLRPKQAANIDDAMLVTPFEIVAFVKR